MSVRTKKAVHPKYSTKKAPPPSVQTPVVFTPTTVQTPVVFIPTTDKEWATLAVKEPTYFLGNKVLHTDTIGMLIMRTDGGKTQWGIGCALAMAYGRPFCEWMPVEPARVLYIEGETSPRRMKRIIQVQRAALGIKDDEVSRNFTLITRQTHGKIPFLNASMIKHMKEGNAVTERDYRGKDWLVEQIKLYQPQFIFFDNLAALAPAMVSTSASGWITQMVEPIIILLNEMGIGQLWFHHPDKSGLSQHGTGARNWGLNLEIFGLPISRRGIRFSMVFPGKKKDDEGDNPDFEPRTVAFNRDEQGISKWVIGPISPEAEAQALNIIKQKEVGSVTIAYEAFIEVVQGKPDVWVSGDVKGQWATRAITRGISTSTQRAHQIRAFTRARDTLIEDRRIERRSDGMCRLFPDLPPEQEETVDLGDTLTVGSA